VPFFAAFVIGCKAAFSEEITYRIFGISWGKKYLKHSAAAVIMVSLIWGFGHAGYLIFRVWFRGMEVTLVGLFMGFVFLQYGIIPVLVTHYLFNVFLGTGSYLLGKSTPYLFFSSLFILAIPLIVALMAFFLNRPCREVKPEVLLDANQRYNLEILAAFIAEKLRQGEKSEDVCRDLITHGWDEILVGLAAERVRKKEA
jgi:hypothetical protein